MDSGATPQHRACGRVGEEHEPVLPDHHHRVGGAGQDRGQGPALVGQRLVRAAGLERARDSGGQQGGDLEVVERVGRGPPREEQRTQDLHPAPQGDREGGLEARTHEHPVEIGRAVGDALELSHEVGPTGADRPPGQPLLAGEQPGGHRLADEAGKRMHEIALLLGVLQAHREVVVRHHRLGLLGEGLEQMGRDRRARQPDEHLPDAPEPASERLDRLRAGRHAV
ncbi:MAG TPA: hypothetical protein VJ971_07990 [Methylomirabilota bacterium]|nr:hypothetical protein [Methylomirabilota bacterium]